MKENFDKAWAFTMEHEGGGKVHKVKGDPGGTTKWGIAQRYHPKIDVANLTEEEAKDIAMEEYWIPARCDQKVWPMDLLAFDTAFNLGLDDVQVIDPKSKNWRDFLLHRVMKHIRVARKLPYKIRRDRWGWMFRCYDLYVICMKDFF